MENQFKLYAVQFHSLMVLSITRAVDLIWSPSLGIVFIFYNNVYFLFNKTKQKATKKFNWWFICFVKEFRELSEYMYIYYTYKH
jgi:hypothetical protein